MSERIINQYNQEFAAANGGTEFFADIRAKATRIDFTQPIDHASFRDFLVSQYSGRRRSTPGLTFSRDIEPLLNNHALLNYIFEGAKAHRIATLGIAPVAVVASTSGSIGQLRQSIDTGANISKEEVFMYVGGGLLAIWLGDKILDKVGYFKESDSFLWGWGKAIVALGAGYLAYDSLTSKSGWIDRLLGKVSGQSENSKLIEIIKGKLTGDEQERVRQAGPYFKASELILNEYSNYSDGYLGDARNLQENKVKGIVDDLEKVLNTGRSTKISRREIERNLVDFLPKMKNQFLKAPDVLGIGVTPLTDVEFRTLPGANFTEKFKTLEYRVNTVKNLLGKVEGIWGSGVGLPIIGNQGKTVEGGLEMSYQLQGTDMAAFKLAKRSDIPAVQLRGLILSWISGSRIIYTSNGVNVTLSVI